MPLVKRNATQPPAGTAAGGDRPSVLAALESPEADARWNAGRALGADPGDVAALAAALDAESVPRVREAIMTALMRVGDQASVKVLLPYLRSPDASRRGAAIDALQSLPEAVAPFMAALLGDEDSDVRILAVEIVRDMPAGEATALLCGFLEAEQHPNACASAVDALAEIGTEEALPTLRRCAERFAGTAFLPFAIAVAITRISEAKGQGANGAN